MDTHPDNLATALAAAEIGIACIPVWPKTKVPMVRWKEYQTRMPTEREFRQWFLGTRTNIAILTTGMVVFDCESLAMAELVLENCGDTPHKLRTPRGVHLGFGKPKGVEVWNQVRVMGKDIDIRTDGGLEIIPASRTEHGCYEWLGEGLIPIADLPVAKVAWTRERVCKVLRPIGTIKDTDKKVRRARAYLACVEGGISGHRGHSRAMRAAGILCQKFGLTPDEAFPLFWEWNVTSCEPPFSEKEAWHKLNDAWRLRGDRRALR